MAKYHVGQEVYFTIGTLSLEGKITQPEILCAVIDSIVTTDYGTSYTFEGLTYRIPESEVFETKEDCIEDCDDCI